jgi:GH25 family lysozyme M1 (1,4-beta-N-acetylmuramidase)
MTYSVVLDVWEGNLEIDEVQLASANIAGLIIRINDMNGGHHLDTNFWSQWNQSGSFNRVPYFVYNPWVNGQQNYDWLLANIPVCPAVMIDTEVTEPNYGPATYAAEHAKFIAMCCLKWKTVIYTGAGFVGSKVLQYWTTGVDYWWSQYPWPLYEEKRPGYTPLPIINVTWGQLKQYLDSYAIWPSSTAKYCPAGANAVKLWQCSGDRFILPGMTRTCDINIFPGTAEEYATWLGYKTAVIPVVPPNPPVVGSTLEQRVAALEAAAKLHDWTLS